MYILVYIYTPLTKTGHRRIMTSAFLCKINCSGNVYLIELTSN